MDSRQIRLLIKTPSQTEEDHSVEGVLLTWTVKDLKTHLSLVHPTEPAVSDQRLIYAGKLLPDHLRIGDLFQTQMDSVPTLHLVCAIRNQSPVQLGARPKVRDTEPHSSCPNSMLVQNPTAPELRQRRAASSGLATALPTTPAAMPDSPQFTPPSFPTYALYSPQQLLWLQHVYARQYYMQYHAALAAAGSAPSAMPPTTIAAQYPPVVPAHQVPVAAPLANQNPIDNLPANQNPAQDGGAFINPGAANQNMRMNAQGGPLMGDEEEVDRDWLDWLYSGARLGVLLMIVYFNSNLSRFLLVMSTLTLMYLHTAGWFPFRRRVPVQQEPQVQHNHNQNLQPDPAAEGAAAQRDAAQRDGGPSPMAAVLVRPHRASVVWTAWVFFKTFFSSLIPDVPQDVAN